MKRFYIFPLFVALSFLTRAVLLPVEIIDLDEAAHITGSWQLMDGKTLYKDFVDNKPPLLYVFFAFPQLLLGRGMLAVHLFTVLLVVPLIAYLLSAFFFHQREGIISGIVFLFYSASFLGHDMLSTNAEILMLLPATAALLLIRDSVKHLSLLAAGFLLGCAVLVKYQAVLWLPAILVTAFLQSADLRKKVLSIALLGISFILPLFIAYAYFKSQNAADELLRWTFFSNLSYSANPIRFSEALQRFSFKFLPFLVATGFLWCASFRSLKIMGRYHRILFLSLLLFSLPAAFVGYRFFPHYFIQLYVPLALASAPYLATILKRPLSNSALFFLTATTFLFVSFTIVNAFLYYGKNGVYEERDPVFMKVAERIRADHPRAKATLFVWGFAPEFYYYARLPIASRFVVPQTSLTGYIAGNTFNERGNADERLIQAEDWQALMHDLERNRATYIIDTSPAGIHRWNYFPLPRFPLLMNYLTRSYYLIDSIDGVQIYRRNE